MLLHAARTRLLTLLLALGLLAAACGGDDAPVDTAAEPAPSPAATDVASDPEPVVPEDEGSRGLSTEAAADQTGPETPPVEATEPVTEEAAPADGTPQAPPGGTFSAGPLTVEATQCDVQGASFVGDSSSSVLPGVAVFGENVYLIDGDNRVTRFVADTTAGCTLTLDPTWGEGGVYTPVEEQDALNIADTGRLVVSGSVFSAEVIDTAADPSGGQSYECDVTGEVEIAPDGTFGVAYFPGSPIRDVAFSDTGCTVTDPAAGAGSLPFADQTILAGEFSAGTFIVGGNLPTDPPTAIVANIDGQGTELWRQGSEDPADFGEQNYGWVHAISLCGPANTAVCTLDTNFRRLQILDASGSWLTSVDLNELLGISSAWWEDMEHDDQGRLWMPVGAGREDGDLADGFVFLLDVSGI